MQVAVEPSDVERIDVNGVGIELFTGGTGRALVFLHPGDGPEQSAPFVRELARHYRVIAPSHPGFGRSDLPDSLTTVDDLSYFYLDLLRQLDLKDVILFGVSFGGWLAAEVAVKCTQRLSGIILADAVGAKFGAPTCREIADLFAVPQYEHSRLLYADPGRSKVIYSDLSDETLTRLARNHESLTLFGWSPTLHNPKLTHRLHRIDVPTLVMWGDADKVVPVEYGRQYAAKIPGASFTLIEGAGHYVHIDRDEAVLRAASLFIDSVPALRS